jgi:hypothetical protein
LENVVLLASHRGPSGRYIVIEPGSSGFRRDVALFLAIKEREVGREVLPREIFWIRLQLFGTWSAFSNGRSHTRRTGDCEHCNGFAFHLFTMVLLAWLKLFAISFSAFC